MFINNFFDTINITLIAVVIVYFLFAYLLFSKGSNRKVTYSYLVVIFSIIVWTIGMILYRGASPAYSLFWCKILYISATFTASSIFIFSFIFPNGEVPSKKVFFLTLLSNILLFIWY